jgi:hypothetical protein
MTIIKRHDFEARERPARKSENGDSGVYYRVSCRLISEQKGAVCSPNGDQQPCDNHASSLCVHQVTTRALFSRHRIHLWRRTLAITLNGCWGHIIENGKCKKYWLALSHISLSALWGTCVTMTPNFNTLILFSTIPVMKTRQSQIPEMQCCYSPFDQSNPFLIHHQDYPLSSSSSCTRPSPQAFDRSKLILHICSRWIMIVIFLSSRYR